MQFRPCGECTACCDGNLKSNSHGNVFAKRNPCVFLVHKVCSVYNDRPNTCRNYQCAWSQQLIDEDLRPDKSGVLVSVENRPNSDKQFLKVMEIKEHVDFETHNKIIQSVERLGAEMEFIGYEE
jgi:hypothetical protein